MVVVARRVGSNVSETAKLLVFSGTTISRVLKQHQPSRNRAKGGIVGVNLLWIIGKSEECQT